MRSLGKNRKDRNGLKQGLWEEYYSGGELRSKGSYKDDKPEGYWEYYTNGRIQFKGSYKYDKADGIWEEYNEDGILKERRLYEDGNFIKWL